MKIIEKEIQYDFVFETDEIETLEKAIDIVERTIGIISFNELEYLIGGYNDNPEYIFEDNLRELAEKLTLFKMAWAIGKDVCTDDMAEYRPEIKLGIFKPYEEMNRYISEHFIDLLWQDINMRNSEND